jgi:hypothetical protein
MGARLHGDDRRRSRCHRPLGHHHGQQIVVVTRKTFTVYYKCVDGEWERY